MNQPRYVSVDDLQAQTTLQEAAAKCSAQIDIHGTGRQVRLDCPFGCPGDHAGKRELSVDTGNPQKVFACHAYGCQLRGNLLTLMHGWLTGTRPTGDKLKGEEFKRVRAVLAGRRHVDVREFDSGRCQARTSESPAATQCPPDPERQRESPRAGYAGREVPLRRGPHAPGGGELCAATSLPYARGHGQVGIGVLPLDGGSDKRGWSLRGQILYPILSEDGKLLAWAARDPQFEGKEQSFVALPPTERAKEKKPAKHRFPVDFHRGLELFGQHAGRLSEPGFRATIAACGVLVVEGFNDVVGLDQLSVPAVAIMSNRITAQQVGKIERWARQLADGKVTLLFDADDAGDEGAKEAFWLLAQRGLDVRLGWSRAMHGACFVGRQPENLTMDEWTEAIRPAIVR